MNTIFRNYFFILLLFSFHILNAQSQELTMTLDEAVAIALENNVDIKKNSNTYKGAKSQRTTSYLSLLPEAVFLSTAYKTEGNIFDEITGLNETTFGEFVTAGFSLKWDILNVLNKHSTLSYAKNNENYTLWNLEDIKDTRTLEVIRLYLEVLQNQDQGKILEAFIKTQETNLEQVDEMIRLGSVAGQDHYNQKTELSRLSSAKYENLRLINEKRNELMLILGIDANSQIEFQSLDIDLDMFDNVLERPLDSLYLEAKNKRNDLKSREFQVQLLKDDINLKRSNYYPNIELFFNYGSGYSSFLARDFNDQFFDDNTFKTYGVQVTIPILNGNKTRNTVFLSKVNYKNAQLDLEQYRKSIYTELSNYQSNIINSLEELNYLKNQQESSKLTYELRREEYFLQATSAQDLSLAYRDYIQADLLLNQAKYQLLLNHYFMKYALGKLRDEFN